MILTENEFMLVLKLLSQEMKLKQLNISKLKKKEAAVASAMLNHLTKPQKVLTNGDYDVTLNSNAKHVLKKLLGKYRDTLQGPLLSEYSRRKMEGLMAQDVFEKKVGKINITLQLISGVLSK